MAIKRSRVVGRLGFCPRCAARHARRGVGFSWAAAGPGVMSLATLPRARITNLNVHRPQSVHGIDDVAKQ